MEASMSDDMEVQATSPIIMNHTSQAQVIEWWNKFAKLYNDYLLAEHVDAFACRGAVNGAILDTLKEVHTLKEAQPGPMIPLAAFIIRIMRNTWLLTHPFATPSGFEDSYLPPENHPRNHDPKYQLIHAPPFLTRDFEMDWIATQRNPVEALRNGVLASLEEQFHAGIQKVAKPDDELFPYADCPDSQWQALYEADLLRGIHGV
ncbi:hypothetical protein QBC39DRAFT_430051 [Podospora conica]|nr:hypothetical protein QBC39DRAFT_430051 [Schizothecium conicum]